MFKKKNTPPANPIQNVSRDADTPKRKYPRPKILLADMGAETQQLLSAEGYNVADGTFGVPYKVPMSSSYSPVIPEYSLPNYAEQEVVVVDLVPADPIDNPEGEKRTPEDEKDWWASCSGAM